MFFLITFQLKNIRQLVDIACLREDNSEITRSLN